MRILSLSTNVHKSDMLARQLMGAGLTVMHCKDPAALRALAPLNDMIVVTDGDALRGNRAALSTVIQELGCHCVVVMGDGDAQGDEHDVQAAKPAGTFEQWLLVNGGLTLVAPTGAKIGLSHSEADFLELLISSQGKVLKTRGGVHLGARKRLMAEETLRTMICRLRRKVAQYGVDLPVRSVYGTGYLFVPKRVNSVAPQARTHQPGAVENP